MDTLEAFVGTCRSVLELRDAAERVALAMEPLLADAALSDAIETLRPPGGGPAVVHRADDLTVLGLAVPAAFVSPIHDHTIWAVVGIYAGNEDNVFYRRSTADRGDADGVIETGRAVLRAGEVLALPPEAVHRIANSGTETMRALHVYGGDLFATERSQWDDETGERRPFGSQR